ncbi:MAG: hypothetical protein Q9206_000710 [Seirophora lacunosa]
MLVEESHQDVRTNAHGEGSMLTGPVARFARQIAGHGYIVVAPSSYHEFTGSAPLAYDVPGTDAGNAYKIKKIHGKSDGHVPPEGRDLIRRTLHEKGVCFSFYEVAGAQREYYGLV